MEDEEFVGFHVPDPGDRQHLSEAVAVLKSRLVMQQWLQKHKWRFVYDELVKVGVHSLQGMADYAEDEEAKIDMLSNFQVCVCDMPFGNFLGEQ